MEVLIRRGVGLRYYMSNGRCARLEGSDLREVARLQQLFDLRDHVLDSGSFEFQVHENAVTVRFEGDGRVCAHLTSCQVMGGEIIVAMVEDDLSLDAFFAAGFSREPLGMWPPATSGLIGVLTYYRDLKVAK